MLNFEQPIWPLREKLAKCSNQIFIDTVQTELTKKRDKTIDILKGIAMVLVVIGHAGCPQVLYDAIYTFHMPLFFIASGYFFSAKSIQEKAKFVLKKIKGIYIPAVICGLLSIFVHNFLFDIGILNDSYGTPNGITTRPLTLEEILVSSAHVIAHLGWYDGFFLGQYWFVRALFLGSLLLCFGTWALNKLIKSVDKSILILAIVCLIVAGVLKYLSVEVPNFPRRNIYWELMATFFIAVGYFMRKNIDWLNESKTVIIVALVGVVVLFLIHPASLNLYTYVIDWAIIPFSGTLGTYILYRVSRKWSQLGHYDFIAYVGEKSFWILSFHVYAFKLSMPIEIWYYDLPAEMISCVLCLPAMDNWFYLVHTVTAVVACLLLAFICSKVKDFAVKRFTRK